MILIFTKKSSYFGGFSECPTIDDDFNRLVCEIENLQYAGDIVVNYVSVGNRKPYKAHHWTILKLVFLKMFVRDVYTPIIGKRYSYMVFIDPFAGTGLDAYKVNQNFQTYIPGSTLITWFFATYPFSKIYAIGYKDNYPVLAERLKAFIPKQRLWLQHGDANILIDRIVSDIINLRDKVKEEIGKGVHYLAFIDPESLEVKWSTINKLFQLEKEGVIGDFIILLQARLIARAIGSIKNRGGKANKLNDFFGTEEWREFIDRKGKEKLIIDFYIKRLKHLKERALMEIINIELMKKAHYYLIYITRETRRGSPYLNTVRWLKNFIERVNRKHIVDNAIRKALGKSISDLTSYSRKT